MSDGIIRLGESLDPALIGIRGERLTKAKSCGVRVADGFILPSGQRIADGLENKILSEFDRLSTNHVIIRSNADEAQILLAKIYSRDELLGELMRIRSNKPNEQIIVQRALNAELSGSTLSMNPESGNPNEIWIEGYWWMGEAYGNQGKQPEIALIEKANGMVVAQSEGDEPIGLSDKHLEDLYNMSMKMEHMMGWPTKLDWAFEDGLLYLLDITKARTLGENKW